MRSAERATEPVWKTPPEGEELTAATVGVGLAGSGDDRLEVDSSVSRLGFVEFDGQGFKGGAHADAIRGSELVPRFVSSLGEVGVQSLALLGCLNRLDGLSFTANPSGPGERIWTFSIRRITQ